MLVISIKDYYFFYLLSHIIFSIINTFTKRMVLYTQNVLKGFQTRTERTSFYRIIFNLILNV